MVTRKTGHIVFISSVAGKVPIPFRSTFAASKHALQAFSDTLRAEMATNQIKVLITSPEYISGDVQLNDIKPNVEMKEAENQQSGIQYGFHSIHSMAFQNIMIVFSPPPSSRSCT